MHALSAQNVFVSVVNYVPRRRPCSAACQNLARICRRRCQTAMCTHAHVTSRHEMAACQEMELNASLGCMHHTGEQHVLMLGCVCHRLLVGSVLAGGLHFLGYANVYLCDACLSGFIGVDRCAALQLDSTIVFHLPLCLLAHTHDQPPRDGSMPRDGAECLTGVHASHWGTACARFSALAGVCDSNDLTSNFANVYKRCMRCLRRVCA